MNSIAIVGAGPTASYALAHLRRSVVPLDITVFEAGPRAGMGMPYSADFNNAHVLANIASVEIPPITRTLVDWLESRPDAQLAAMKVDRSAITDRAFFPRVVLGEYFASEFERVCVSLRERGHAVRVITGTRVDDVVPRRKGFTIVADTGGRASRWRVDTVLLATGHKFTQSHAAPHLYRSPYPLAELRLAHDRSAAVLGSSLSAIDAVITLACRYGRFEEKGDSCRFVPSSGRPLRLAMFSRKGLLPEADFYYPIPEEPLKIFGKAAAGKLVSDGGQRLLFRAMKLFWRQLVLDDPAFVETLNLGNVSPARFHDAYFAWRGRADPFALAAANLREARANYADGKIVMWRYTLMRAHEIFALITPHLPARDLARFHHYLRPVFADAYGCVPHQSISRLIALKRAGVLSITAMGEDGKAVWRNDRFEVKAAGRTMRFATLIDARGQQAMSLRELGFERLSRALVDTELGDADLDGEFRLRLKPGHAGAAYCVSLPILLHRHPFAQGLVACASFGSAVAQEMLANTDRRAGALQTLSVPALSPAGGDDETWPQTAFG